MEGFVGPDRRRMPDDRLGVTCKFSIGGHEGYVTLNAFEENGELGEMFLHGIGKAAVPALGDLAAHDDPVQGRADYLVRLRIVQTPWFGIYLHDIHEDDGDRDPHNHPWSFLSFVLRGYYTERVYPDPLGAPGLHAQDPPAA
jgi:hypothetical protein